MKLNEMFDRMTVMLPHVANIVGDADVKALQARIRAKESGGALLNSLYPLMLTKHRDDVRALIGAACGKTAEEAADMPYEDVKAVLESGFWDDFFDFFPLFLHMVIKS